MSWDWLLKPRGPRYISRLEYAFEVAVTILAFSVIILGAAVAGIAG